ncbi:MAG: ferredoxin [Alphaproteobacteria bacterium]
MIRVIDDILDGTGLFVRGIFHPEPDDGVPALAGGRAAATVVLVGNAGKDLWQALLRDNAALAGKNPLDTWVDGHLERAAAAVRAKLVYATRKPWPPIQRWALRAGGVFRSPIGILIHPEFGLWHVYRGALLFAETLSLPTPLEGEGLGMRGRADGVLAAGPSPLASHPADAAHRAGERGSPCDTCAEKPCLTTCPADAFSLEGFDALACVDHVESPKGKACTMGGCLARRACPVGRPHAYELAEGAFHMAAVVGTVRKMQARGEAPWKKTKPAAEP